MGRRAVAERQADLDEQPESVELFEIPAAVVCATCGLADCPGCAEADEPTHGSGVVAVVPWERPGDDGAWERLWSTARLATVNAPGFFGALPDGGVAAPFRFAVAAEALAIGSLVMTAAPIVYASAPRFVEALMADPSTARLIVLAVLVGLPLAALGMVGLHAVWGLTLEVGARRVGSKARWRRGLRFAMYSCGWDAVTSPVGFVTLSVQDGTSQAVDALQTAVSIPSRATRAYARGVHGLKVEDARKASRTAMMLTGGLIAVGAVGAIALATFVAVVSSV